MAGTGQTQPRDAAHRFVRLTRDIDDAPHPCERITRSFTGEPISVAARAEPTQKRMRNPGRIFAAAEHLRARKVDLDWDFEDLESHDFAPGGRLRSASSILRDGAFRQHRSHKRGDVHLGLPSTLVPDHAPDAFAVALAGRTTGLPAELLWARWGGLDGRRTAARLAWKRLIGAGEVDASAPWQRSARRATLHGATRGLYGRRGTRSYATAAKSAGMRVLAFTRISKLAQREVIGALIELQHAFIRARFGNDL